MAGQTTIRASTDFEGKINAAFDLALRTVSVQVLYHRPDRPLLLQEFTNQLSDFLNLGLTGLHLLRVAIEHPDMAPFVLPYAKELINTSMMNGRLEILAALAEQILCREDANPSPSQLKSLREKSDFLLMAMFSKIVYFPSEFSIDFRDAMRGRVLHNFPDIQERKRMMAEHAFSSPATALERTTKFVDFWLTSIEGIPNLIRVANRAPITRVERDDLMEAHEERMRATYRAIEERMAQGNRILPVQTSALRLH
jgi:uncharacterized protein Usg